MMKLKVTLFGVLTAVSFGIVAPYASGQNFDNGLAAAQSGDYATALQEWRPLAEQGNADAQTYLGVLYKSGAGVPQDSNEAVKWYQLAAEQKHFRAQFSLGVMHSEGNGVPQSYIRAHMWFNLAAAAGENRARVKREEISKKMTPTQIEKAQALATECLSKNYKGC